VSEERLYQIHRSSIIGHLGSEMRYVNGATNLRESCTLMLRQASTFLSRMSFEAAQPAASRAISGG
jgi:hypothetical protein